MSQINLKSITGITSITTPTGVDNQLTLHNNNTTEAVKLDTAGNLHFHNHLNITGVSTAANFKTGTSNLHSTGLNIFDLDVDGNMIVSGISTFNGDVTLTGGSYNVVWDKSDNQLEFGDNAKLSFGGQADMRLFHDGTNSVITNATGDLYINNNADTIIKPANDCFIKPQDGENGISVIGNGAVELYFNNSKKIETTNTGATVTGTLTATAFSGDGSALTGTGVGSNSSVNTTGIVTATAFVGDFQPRNMIINGAMQINARLQGTLTINSSSSQYPCDRWVSRGEGGSKAFTIEKTSIASSGRGVRNAIKVVSSQAASVSSHDIFNVRQNIEGFNIQRLNLGEAGCASMTLSFTCYSSVAGTHSGAIQNSAQNRSYPFTYTLAQNTWTDVKITIPPITSGSFNEDTGVGLRVVFDMGSGSAFRGTANQWNSAQNEGATGAVRILETNGATWWVSKVQLEEGTVATPFEKRLVADEIKECERYYQRYGAQRHMWMTNVNGGDHRKMVYFPTTMRAAPSMNLYDQSVDGSSVSAAYVTPNGYSCRLNGNGRHAAWKHEATAEI